MTGILRTIGPRWVSIPVRGYIEVFRCTPLLVQLVWVYYALPVLIGVDMSATTACFLTLSLYAGSFYAEIFRGGIEAIDRGQWEAGQAIGMREGRIFRRIVLPQAIQVMVPSFINETIIQLKNTSLVSTVAVGDLLYQGSVSRELSAAGGLYHHRGALFRRAVSAHPRCRPDGTTAGSASVNPANPILAARNIRKAFGTNQVLKGVSLTVARGEVVSLIGASGSGKSTFLRCLNLLETPQEGELAIGRHRFEFGKGRRAPDKEQLALLRRDVGMVFQHFNLCPHRTVIDNIIEAPVQVGLPRPKRKISAATS